MIKVGKRYKFFGQFQKGSWCYGTLVHINLPLQLLTFELDRDPEMQTVDKKKTMIVSLSHIGAIFPYDDN